MKPSLAVPLVAKAKSNEDDLENILNYENSEEIKRYEVELREKYSEAYGEFSHDTAQSLGTNLKKSDSFTSLVNILSTVRKSNLSASVSASRENLMKNFRELKEGRKTQSQPARGGARLRRGSVENLKGSDYEEVDSEETTRKLTELRKSINPHEVVTRILDIVNNEIIFSKTSNSIFDHTSPYQHQLAPTIPSMV